MTTMAPDNAPATDPAGEMASANSPVGDARGLVGVALFSESPAELAAFYGMLLGLRFERRLHEDGREHRIARMGEGSNALHFEIKAARTTSGEVTPDGLQDAGAGAIELSFEVADAQAAYDYALTLGGQELLPVTQEPYGMFGSVLDLDGNRLALYTPRTDNTEGS